MDSVMGYSGASMGGSGMAEIASNSAKSSAVTTKSAVEVRQDFPETWLFELQMAGWVASKKKY